MSRARVPRSGSRNWIAGIAGACRAGGREGPDGPRVFREPGVSVRRRSAAILLLATVLGPMSTGCCYLGRYGGAGCGIVDTFMDRQVACMRDHVWAKRAFHLRHGHCERLHADHFQDGFIAGYSDICRGGCGECPAVPPEKYWGFQYRTQEGAEMQTAWFEGFEEGAMSAKSDGTGAYRNIQVSHQINELLMQNEAVRSQHAGVRNGTSLVAETWHPHNGTMVPGSMFGAALEQPGMPLMPMSNTPVTIPGQMAGMETPMQDTYVPMPVNGPGQVPIYQGSPGRN